MSLKSSNKIETNVYELEVAISAEDFKAATAKVFNSKKNQIAIPGWRKGKAPRSMVEAVYGKGVFYDEALEELYPAAVDEAIKEAGIDPVDSPSDVDIKEIGEDTGVLMTMKITVRPEISLKSYKGIEAPKAVVEVADEEVDEEINRLLDRNARFITVEDRAAENGDSTFIDFEGFVDDVAFEGGKGENHELVLGSGHFIPGFEDQIVGHNTGDEFDVNVTFPEEYTPELAGKAAVFKVKLNEIKAKQLPELDDEFAKDVGEDYETVEELKTGIRNDILKRKTDTADANFEDEVLKALAGNVEGEIPEVMYTNKAKDNMDMFARRIGQQGIDVDTYLMYMGIDKEQYESDMYNQAVDQVKVRLALEEIVKLESIEVTEEDLEAEYARLAEQYGVSVEVVKQYFNADNVKADLSCEKAVKLVVDNAVIVEKAEEPSEEEAEGEDK